MQEITRYDKREFSFGEYNSLCRIEKKVLHLIVHFEPFAIIRNCLPFPIHFEVSDQKTAEIIKRSGTL